MDLRTLHNIENLVFKDILEEDRDNLTREFQHNIRVAIEKIAIMIKTNVGVE